MLRPRAVAVWLRGLCDGKVATILIIFSHILTIFTQIERKNSYRFRYTFKKANYLLYFLKNCIFFI